jgi:SAM-dependent methyltransferase
VTEDSRRFDPIVFPDWDPLIPPRNLWVGPTDPFMHFLRWPWEYFAYLTLLAGLRRDSRVLELGCNHGRTMLGLMGYLKAPGRYDGLDILRPQVEFAREHVKSDRFGIQFHLADIFNGVYNPSGKCLAAEYQFPFPESHFDVAYAASLFTHLVPPDASHYLAQTRRVLSVGGRALYSFFVLDHYRGKGTSTCDLYEFDTALPGHTGVAVRHLHAPEAVIAYSVSAIEEMAATAHLKLIRVIPGLWSNPPDFGVHEQDQLLLEAI